MQLHNIIFGESFAYITGEHSSSCSIQSIFILQKETKHLIHFVFGSLEVGSLVQKHAATKTVHTEMWVQ